MTGLLLVVLLAGVLLAAVGAFMLWMLRLPSSVASHPPRSVGSADVQAVSQGEGIRPELAAAFGALDDALQEIDTLDDESLDFETDIVGESFDGRQDALWAIAKRVTGGDVSRGIRFMARLVPEPANKYDSNAVAVVDHDSDTMLGYLARQLAKAYQPAVLERARAGATLAVPAVVRGGDRLGVWLDLTRFNETAGLQSPEALLEHADSYFERRHQAGLIDGVPWSTHHALAKEAARLAQHDAAAESYDKAARGWFGACAFEGSVPGSAGLFEDYARWCRKAKMPDIELVVLRCYADAVAVHDPGSRCNRMQKRLAEVNAKVASEAPF